MSECLRSQHQWWARLRKLWKLLVDIHGDALTRTESAVAALWRMWLTASCTVTNSLLFGMDSEKKLALSSCSTTHAKTDADTCTRTVKHGSKWPHRRTGQRAPCNYSNKYDWCDQQRAMWRHRGQDLDALRMLTLPLFCLLTYLGSLLDRCPNQSVQSPWISGRQRQARLQLCFCLTYLKVPHYHIIS